MADDEIDGLFILLSLVLVFIGVGSIFGWGWASITVGSIILTRLWWNR